MTVVRQRRLPFVVFELMGNLYAIACRNVSAIIATPEVTGIPEVPPEIRGVIKVRGKIIKLVDLRVKLGMPPRQTELDALVQLLRDREQDHRNWLAELEACVREHRPFKLARDPHQCKFGKWYDGYRAKDQLLGMVLPSMDAPHKAIHATANEVLRLAEAGDEAGALELIESRRNQELKGLIKLFAEARSILQEGHREVAIILAHGNDQVAFAADRVEAAEHIPEENIEPMPCTLQELSGGFNCRVARRPKTNQTILLLDEDALFAGKPSVACAS